ncbi:NPC intracellular cholesterol transporter 2 [Trichonephila inaurata madagascariensis]|uniref:NPC intracellular cholesterol transporter 2 n=1 Tax=Trichonephila inaurata madagascariensis TaxID=2747483 RepID=A0A8X6YLQ2_9ARAC|nr:NPC intracellular cholesterol transporter 2 [Trichonephila inaurata madagascariensis]
MVYGINHSDCGSTRALVHNVQVKGCDEVDLCPLIRNNSTELEITFEVDSEVENLKPVVKGDVNDNDFFLPFNNFPEKDACVRSGLACPLVPGQKYTYNSKIEVKNYYPPVKSNVKWQLKNGKDTILCVHIPSIIM